MKITVIGAGNMGGAIARGLSGTDMEVVVTAAHESSLERLASTCAANVSTSTDNTSAVRGADIIILAVKPWLIADVLRQIAPAVAFRSQTIVSLAAGVTLADMDEIMDSYSTDRVLMRAIPNTALTVGKSVTFICGNANATPEKTAAVESLFRRMGTVEITDEAHLAAYTALCSCGIAYAMRYVRACVNGAVELGIPPAKATRLAAQTMAGAIALLEHGGGHPEQEIDKVTTPGGLTIRGLNAMEAHGFTTAVIEGLKSSMP